MADTRETAAAPPYQAGALLAGLAAAAVLAVLAGLSSEMLLLAGLAGAAAGGVRAAAPGVLTILSGAGLGYVSLELLFQLACSLGLVYRRVWAARGIFYASLMGAGVTLFELKQLRFSADFLLWAYGGSSLVLAVMFRNVSFREFFMTGPDIKSPRKILLIDDDKGLLQLLSQRLNRQGYITLMADSGERGLALARSQRPDLILLDVILPGIKGREVCVRLKEDPSTQDIPVVFLTIKDTPDDISAEIAAGAVAHITKPVDFRRLTAEIKKYIRD